MSNNDSDALFESEISENKNFSLFSLGGCLFLFIFILMIIGVGVGVTLAKTGLVNVPILSKVLKTTSSPTRLVSSSDSVSLDLSRLITEKISSEILKTGRVPETLRISEAEATAIMKSYFETKSFVLESPQMVFLEGGIEFFGIVGSEKRNSTLIVSCSLSFDDGVLNIRSKRVAIGSIGIPSIIPNIAIATIFSKDIERLEQEIKNSPIKDFSIKDGFLELFIDSKSVLSL